MEEDKWRIIDTHVNSMIDWTKGLSTTPSGNQPPTTQRQGHIHRRSEPDVVMIRQAQMSRINASGQLPVPPQSAPVQPGTFSLEWNSMPKTQLHGCEDESAKEENDVISENLIQFPNLENYGANVGSRSPLTTPKNPNQSHRGDPAASSLPINISSQDHEHSGFGGIDTPPRPPPYQRVITNGPGRTGRPLNGIGENHFSSSPRMTDNPYRALMTVKTPTGNTFGYPSPKTNRRSSMPGNQLDPRAQSASPNITRRSISTQPKMPSRRRTQDSFIPSMMPTGVPVVSIPHSVYNSNSESIITSLSNKKPDDQEYTIALLQHQRDRMERLEKELNAKKGLLESLSATVVIKEKEAGERRNEEISRSMPTSEEIRKLREINRKMEIECNCMIKEVDMVSSSGHHSMEGNFHDYIMQKVPSGETRNRYSRKQKDKVSDPQQLPSPPLPPPPPPPSEDSHSFSSTQNRNRHSESLPSNEDEDAKWACRYCTFLNHGALDKCELCEYRRDRASAS